MINVDRRSEIIKMINNIKIDYIKSTMSFKQTFNRE